MNFKALPLEASGCIAYLVGCERDGVAALVDPVRGEIDTYLELTRSRGLALSHIIDTHIHADHVSGNRELAARTGAKLCLHEAAEVHFPFTPLADGARLTIGSVALRILHTPGHTPESLCVLVTDTARGPDPWFVLTGDTLFVGDVGRPDFGGEAAGTALHRSLFERLLTLDDSIEVYPAHGAGSACGRAMSGKLGSTIGFERRFNLALRHAEPDQFVRALLEGLPAKPPTMERIIAQNRGAVRATEAPPSRIGPGELAAQLAAGVVLVDIRDPRAFGIGHVGGSLNVSVESPQFAERVSWFVPANQPIALLAQTEGDAARAVSALARSGIEDVVGYVVGDGAMPASRLPVAKLENLTAPEMGRRLAAEDDLLVLDVREPLEWDAGHVPGAIHIPMRELPRRTAELPRDRPIAVICRSGLRSSTIASLLLTQGFIRLANVWGGMTGWMEAGLPVTTDTT